jgi:hypothetical protein
MKIQYKVRVIHKSIQGVKEMKRMFIPFLGIIVFIINTQVVFSQSNGKKFEVGGQFATIYTTTVQGAIGNYSSGFNGGGARVGFNPRSRFGIEAEINFFPGGNGFPDPGDRKQALFGVKIAVWRGKSFAFYGKARAGVMQIGRLPDCPDADINNCTTSVRKGLAFDVGGVMEYNFTKRVFMRVDFGDTIIRYKRRNLVQDFPEAPGGFLYTSIAGRNTNNQQTNIGVGFRF